MDITPNTVNYMVAGYIVFSVIFVAYVVSLVTRWRGFKRDLQMLKEIGKK